MMRYRLAMLRWRALTKLYVQVERLAGWLEVTADLAVPGEYLTRVLDEAKRNGTLLTTLGPDDDWTEDDTLTEWQIRQRMLAEGWLPAGATRTGTGTTTTGGTIHITSTSGFTFTYPPTPKDPTAT